MKLLWPLVNLLQGLFFVVWTALLISLAILATLVSFSRDVALVMARRLWAPPLIGITGSRFVVELPRGIDWGRPHIYAMNHQSMLDIACAFAALPVNLRFVAKHTLKYVPFLGWYMWMTRMVFINRSHRRKAVKSLKEAGARIREGANILAFPEGTRSRDGRLLPFKKGIFLLALEAGVPVVPVAVEGSYAVLPSDGLRIRPGVIRVKVGEPIHTSGRSSANSAALMGEVRDAIAALQAELGGPPPHAQPTVEERRGQKVA